MTEDALDLDLRNRKAMDHMHNLRAKAGSGLLVALRTALADGVPDLKEALNKSSSFQEITDIFVTFGKTPAITYRLEEAAQAFCVANGMAYGFWSQSRFLDRLNTERKDVVHCKAADSAAAMSDDALIAGVDFKGADALVDALSAAFAAKHGDELDAAAEVERMLSRRAQEELKQLRSKRAQGKQ